MEAGQEHQSNSLMLTAARAILQFGSDPAERAMAKDTLAELAVSAMASTKERREALIHLQFGEG